MPPLTSNAAPEPLPAPAAPTVVPRRPQSHQPGRRWIFVLTAAVVAAAGIYWLLARRQAAQQASPSAAFQTRTATVIMGPLDATVRLTGVTAAENFASLLTPQLRGSRSQFGRDRSSTASSDVTTVSVTSNASSSNSSSSSSSSSGSSSNMSSALVASTTRVASSSASTTASSASSSSSSTAATSTSMGSSGLGSTGDQLVSTGGGDGGNDFMLVLQKMIAPGTQVRKGEMVAEFDRQYMLLRLDDYRASVTQAEADLRKLKSNLEVTRKAHDQSVAKAKGTLDKARLDMKTLPVLSDIDAARARLAVQEAEATYKELAGENRLVEISIASQIRDSEIEVEQTRIELRRAEANAARMLVKAPLDGIAVAQTIFRGGDMAQIQQGDQLWPGMMFMTVADPSSMVVNATVNQSDVERLRIGARARVRFDAYPDLELPARVYSVGGIARQGGQRASFVKEIPIKLKLDRLDPRVIPDLSVAADVIVESEPQPAAIVPLGSIFEDAPGRPFVFVRSPGGWLRRPVELGVVSYTQAAIRDGLKSNEVVALDRPRNLTGQPQ